MPLASEYDDDLPALLIRFPDITTMEVLSVARLMEGLGLALTRANQIIAPDFSLEFRARIYAGSMNIEIFTGKKQTRWQEFRAASWNEMKVSPVKVVTTLVTGGLLAAITMLGGDSHSDKAETIHRISQTADRPVELDSNLFDIGHAISHDRRFCKEMGKAFKAIWDEPGIRTMEIYQVPNENPIILDRNEIASAHLECRARRRK